MFNSTLLQSKTNCFHFPRINFNSNDYTSSVKYRNNTLERSGCINNKIILKYITGQDLTLCFIKPYLVYERYENNEIIFDDNELDIHIVAKDKKDLLNQLNEEFVFLWKEFAKEDENKLHKSAKELKRKILNLLKEV